MELNIVNNEVTSRFETKINEYTPYVEYVLTKDKQLVITSTQVPDALGGRGIAGEITKFALEYAKENGLTVNPVCPYTMSYFEKHPEYADLLFVKE